MHVIWHKLRANEQVENGDVSVDQQFPLIAQLSASAWLDRMMTTTLDKAIDKAFNPYWPELPHAKQFQALCMFDQRDLFSAAPKGPGKTSFQLMNATQFYDHPQSHSLILSAEPSSSWSARTAR